MMNLRKSWVNVSLLKLIIKNNLFPAKISLIIFTAVYLLSLLVINSDFNVICLIVFAFSAVILTFIYPCYLQSYLVDKNKSALIVSLPLDTKTVWLTNYLAGYLIALVTLLLEGIMLVIMMFVLKLDYIPNNLYLRFLLTIIILLFIYYTITFLVCCMSGKRLGQVAFSIMFYCMPLILIAGFTYISPRLVPMTIESVDSWYYFMMIPLAAGIGFIQNGSHYLLIHFLTAVLLLILSYYVYKHRENEYVGEPLVFFKISIFLKMGLIIVGTILFFCLILIATKFDLNYGISGILMMFLIYMIIGILVSLIVEVIFKGNHIYRNLAIYIPVIAMVFGLNYLIVNERYLNFYKNEENLLGSINNIYLSDYNYSLELDTEMVRDVQDYLSKHRNKVYVDEYFEKQKERMSVHIYNDNVSYDLFADSDLIVDFFENEGNKYFDELFEYDDLVDEKYVSTYINFDEYHGINFYFNQDDINKLMASINNQKIVPKDLIEKDFIEFYGSHDKWIIPLDDQLFDIIKDEAFLKRSIFVGEANTYLYDLTSEIASTSYAPQFQAVLENVVGEKISLYYLNTETEYDFGLEEFSDTQVIYSSLYNVVTRSDEEHSIVVKYTAEKNGDTFVVTSIEAGELDE